MSKYKESDFIAAAKRDNNKKRNYIIVNKLQGKHVPAIPSESLKLFNELSNKIKNMYTNERLLIIGFAETATAIGAAAACEIDCLYMQTTRENIKNVEYLYFTEEHSHASEQKLVKNDLDNIIDSIDTIVFVEDEITTGNTIKNIINIIRKTYIGKKIKFNVFSILNGMENEMINKFKEYEIEFFYLIKTNNSLYEKKALSYKDNGKYYDMFNKDIGYNCVNVEFSGLSDARRTVKSYEYKLSCEKLSEKILNYIQLKSKNILVLGTEEFMYPALYTAFKLEKSGNNVLFHATTRSPITVSSENEYPLYSRYHLKSMYDKNRQTYIYNIKKYDYVLIITDAENEYKAGLQSLTAALKSQGNKNIYMFRWCL